MVATTGFAGFGPNALDFLSGLAADNSKSYFDAHRATYDEQVAGPMRALVVDVGSRLTDHVSPNIRAEPKVGRSLFRINRDLRFAKDKTPYHTYVDAVFWEGDAPRTSPSFILRIAAEEVVVGAGVFGLDKPSLARWRDAVVDDETGGTLVDIIAETEREVPGASLSAPTRARVPKGFPADHPRADLLRRDAVHLSAGVEPPPSLTTPHFVDWLLERYAGFAAFQQWLVQHVEEPLRGARTESSTR